jgi:hypothetical protein
MIIINYIYIFIKFLIHFFKISNLQFILSNLESIQIIFNNYCKPDNELIIQYRDKISTATWGSLKDLKTAS